MKGHHWTTTNNKNKKTHYAQTQAQNVQISKTNILTVVVSLSCCGCCSCCCCRSCLSCCGCCSSCCCCCCSSWLAIRKFRWVTHIQLNVKLQISRAGHEDWDHSNTFIVEAAVISAYPSSLSWQTTSKLGHSSLSKGLLWARKSRELTMVNERIICSSRDFPVWLILLKLSVEFVLHFILFALRYHPTSD